MYINITGASGFVGQNLGAHLQERRHRVQAVSMRQDGWQGQVVKNADAIIHLAGKAHDTSNTSDEEEYFKVNRDLTIDLFQLFLNSEIKDFFYFSSVKAVADSVEGVLMEEVVPTPLTPYGKSKNEAEQYLLKQELPKDKRLFIIRPSMIHGPGNKGNLNLLYNIVKKGIPWPLAAYNNERSFLGIDNLNYLIQEMLEAPKLASGVYNFTDDEFVSTNQLITIISSCEGKKPRLWYLSPKTIQVLAKIGDNLRLPLNSERLQKLTENYKVSNNKIKTALGIDSLPLSAEQGLTKTIISFKSVNK